ncbi:MAG: hypothetical protein RBS78_08155 [Coriobacteriia bacterium]|jgi:hypothetical protein|nr:hypothetical protein [Coriobacteriia bacterium]
MSGPSPSVPRTADRGFNLATIAAAWLLLAAASAAHFVFETAVAPSVEDRGLVLAVALASTLLLLVAGGWPRLTDLRSLGIRHAAYALLAGMLGLAVAPALVTANRYSDAPAGAVVAFWTLAAWGLLLVAVSAWKARRSLRVAGALVSLVGCMGILGSWERPSSFSLLVRFPREEIAFMIAGVAWAAFAFVTGSLAREHGARAVYALAGAGGLVGALAWGITATGWDLAALLPPASVLPAALTAGIMAVTTAHLVRKAGAHLPGAAMLAGPALITTLLVVEEATGTFGPRPVILTEAWWGAAVAIAGIAVVLTGSRLPAGQPPPHSVLSVVGTGLAIGSAGVALCALALPGVAVVVRGTTAAGATFTADFTLSAFRTVGGWLALAACALALAAWRELPGRVTAAVALAAGVIVSAAHRTLAFTPLHTWMPWIPAEVQHDYGTEYASIVFSEVSTTAQVVGIIGACLALGALLVWRSLSNRSANTVSNNNAGGSG